MKRVLSYIIRLVPATLLVGVILPSCVYDSEEPDMETASIRINTKIIDSSRSAIGTVEGDNTFMALLWRDYTHLDPATSTSVSTWPAPYVAGHAPQPVPFYEQTMYDLRYPYPDANSYIYATGYAPGSVVVPVIKDDYSRLIASVKSVEKGRYDFLGCDLWPEVYKGSRTDPFAQEKNRLYFRHLAAKLLFFADRDRETMENKQFVRKVKITKLYMSIDGGKTWTEMYTPLQFKWSSLADGDFTSAYNKTIDAVKATEGNIDRKVGKPVAGYQACASDTFAGSNVCFVLKRRNSNGSDATDRVPVYGMKIDSCYVCNRINESGQADVGEPIMLKMDISAEMSFKFDFPLGDGTSGTDDLTFTRTWTGVELGAIYKLDSDGEVTTETVSRFMPGNEYRVYIHFSRTGVNLVATELPWNYGGVHYVTIPGGKQDNNKSTSNE